MNKQTIITILLALVAVGGFFLGTMYESANYLKASS